MLKSFAAVTDNNTRILVVGTMPGEASLKAGEYYAYKYNHFWPIVFELFNGGNALTSYQSKLALLLANNIGLWDSLKHCRRIGSLDKDIQCEKPNNFKLLFKKRPAIKRVIFNGQTARKFFMAHNEFQPGYEYLLMPSTSPANAGKPFKEKLALWRDALLLDN